MKKEILITLLCAGLMLVTPLSGIAKENTVSNKILDQPDDIDELATKIRTLVDEILEKYGHIPIVSNFCNMIYSSLGLVDNIIYCVALIIIAIPIFFIVSFNWIFFEHLGILALILTSILMLYSVECSQSLSLINFLNPLKTRSTFTEHPCPCLQE